MKLGLIGLGKMGKGLALNLLEQKFEVHAFNRSPEPLEEVVKAGAIHANSPEEMANKLPKPRIIWFMLTAGTVLDDILFSSGFINSLEPGDIIIDGGNSNFNDSIRRYDICKEKGIDFLDAGVSGGPSGARSGAAIMVGGDKAAFEKTEPIFKALSKNRTYSHVGPAGSGHFVKMVHNAIEYGMLQAIAEGYELLEKGPYKNLDLTEVTRVYQNGTIISGFLIDTLKKAYQKNPDFKGVKGYIEDSGEGKWAIETALDFSVPFTLNTYALMFRYISRQDQSYAAKVVAALRHEFGGHEIKSG